MTAHELAHKLLEMPDVEVEIRNAAGDMGGEVEAVRYDKSPDGSESIQIDSECNDDELPKTVKL